MDLKLSDDTISKTKSILEEKEGREYSWNEASDIANSIAKLASILVDICSEDQARKKKLELFPKGFHLEGDGYTCSICGHAASQRNSWYDKWGIKCMACQKGIERKEIPPSLAKNKESWYSMVDLKLEFNLKSHVVRSWIKKGIINARAITKDGKGVHFYLFLIKENKGFLPPKKLLKRGVTKEIGEDNKEWIVSRPWYYFCDPAEHLKGYGIMDYLEVIY